MSFLDDGHAPFRCVDAFHTAQDQDTVSEADKDCLIEVGQQRSSDSTSRVSRLAKKHERR